MTENSPLTNEVLERACETDEITNYLNQKIKSIEEGGGGLGVSKKYVDDQDAILQGNITDGDTALQTNIDAETTARTEADTAINERIDGIVPPDTSEFALKEELDTEYIESDPYPAVKNKDGTPKYKLMLNQHLVGLQDQIFTSKTEIDLLEEENKSLEARIKALEDAGSGTGTVSGSGAKTILLQYGEGVTETDLYISKDDYENNKDFIIDENYISYYTTSKIWHIIIPISMAGMTVASSKVLRFRRLHGVNMEYYGVPPLVVEGMTVKTPNSVRISIASDNGDGTLNEIQDLIYKDEYIDIKVSYDATGNRQECVLLTELPLLKVQSSLSVIPTSNFDQNTKDQYTDLMLGVPLSEMLTWNPTNDDGSGNPLTPHWEYGLIFMVKIGTLDPTNPFYRSIKGVPEDQWTDLIFPVQVPDGAVDEEDVPINLDVVITNYQINKDSDYGFLMRELPEPTEEVPNPIPILYTLPAGNHFPRFKQNGRGWDSIRHTMFNADVTGEHTHRDGNYTSQTLTLGGSNSYIWNKSIPPINNSGNMSYETAPRWFGVQGWVYL